MTPRRAVVCALIVLVVVGAFLGFAAGDAALHLWTKHPRQTLRHDGNAPRIAWKTAPGAITMPLADVGLAVIGLLVFDDTLTLGSDVSRPPFIPPRA